MRASLVLLAGCITVLPFTALAAPATVTNLVVFGDSLSDNGNASIASGGRFPGPNYAIGAYTDGPNTIPATTGPFGLWSDQFAQKLGVADPLPFLSGKSGATDFAVGTAQTGSNGLFFVTDQVNTYLASTLGHASPQSLYTFWAGANDITDNATADPVKAADNIEQNILMLASLGAKDFLWLNLPPLGDTPAARALDTKMPGLSALLNAQSAAFNNEWQIDISKLNTLGVDVTAVDVNGIFQAIAANYIGGCTVGAANPFCFANVTSPAQGVAGVDPNTYVFWDTRHPTTEADSLITSAALKDFEAAPEVSSGALSVAGLALIGVAFLRRRRTAKIRV